MIGPIWVSEGSDIASVISDDTCISTYRAGKVCRVHLRPVMASYRRGISLDSASFAGVFSTALGGAGAICKIEYNKAIPADMHRDIYLSDMA